MVLETFAYRLTSVLKEQQRFMLRHNQRTRVAYQQNGIQYGGGFDSILIVATMLSH